MCVCVYMQVVQDIADVNDDRLWVPQVLCVNMYMFIYVCVYLNLFYYDPCECRFSCV